MKQSDLNRLERLEVRLGCNKRRFVYHDDEIEEMKASAARGERFMIAPRPCATTEEWLEKHSPLSEMKS